MGQFKPMVKMMTTEPSIELKLKKGGHVAMPKMKSKDNGTGSKKMADGGMSGVLSRAGLPPGPVGGLAPAAPSMAMRRKAMKGRRMMKDGGDTALEKHASMPASKAHKGLKTGGVAMGQGGYANGGVIKSTKGETMMHTAKPDHSPAKTGGVKMGNGGGYKRGGKIKMADGGAFQPPKYTPQSGTVQRPSLQSGTPNRVPARVTSSSPPQSMSPSRTPPNPPTRISLQGSRGANMGPPEPPMRARPSVRPAEMGIKRESTPTRSEPSRTSVAGTSYSPVRSQKKGGVAKYAKGGGVEGNVSSSHPGVTGTTTGGVRKGNAGGYKKGGALKKFARGGSVNDSGKAEKMPQGYKKPPTPVSINQLSGTYKKGGKVRKYAEGGMSDKEQAKAYDRFYADEKAENEADREAMLNALKNPVDALKSLPDRLRKGYEELKKGLQGSGSVTTTEREVSRTVTPAKKRYGGAC